MSRQALSPDDIYESLWPHIKWREPIEIQRTDGVERLGCRLCIARYGLAARDIQNLFSTFEEWAAHMEQFHPKGEADGRQSERRRP